MLLSLMPLLLVKPLMGLGPVEFDFELRIELKTLDRKIGLIIGKQAFKKKELVSDTIMLFKLGWEVTHKI